MGGVIGLKDAFRLVFYRLNKKDLRKKNATRATVLAFVKVLDGYMIELIERNL